MAEDKAPTRRQSPTSVAHPFWKTLGGSSGLAAMCSLTNLGNRLGNAYYREQVVPDREIRPLYSRPGNVSFPRTFSLKRPFGTVRSGCRVGRAKVPPRTLPARPFLTVTGSPRLTRREGRIRSEMPAGRTHDRFGHRRRIDRRWGWPAAFAAVSNKGATRPSVHSGWFHLSIALWIVGLAVVLITQTHHVGGASTSVFVGRRTVDDGHREGSIR
jgi:hypothetical protein